MSATLTRSLRALRIATRSSAVEGPGAAAAGPSTVAARRWNSGDAASAAGEVAPSESEGAQAASSASAAPAADSSASSATSASTSASAPTAPSAPSSSRKPSPSPTAFQPALAHYPIPRPSTFISSTHLPADALPQHQHINFPQRQFAPPAPSAKPATLGGNEQARKEAMLSATTGLSVAEIKGLRRYTVRVGRVTQMTKKGKMPSFTALVVVGSPTRGMVGIGWGRGAVLTKAADQGFSKAVQSMDYVNRYENRTIWGSGKDMENKWGAVKVIMRARPAGFGLMVPPALHRVFTACGIRDASATIEGSRNPVEVVKCAIQMLHGGSNPPGFGSGLGGKGRREDKGRGMKSRDEIERERGRYGVDVGRRI